MEVGRHYRTAVPFQLAGSMAFNARPPVYCRIMDGSHIDYAGRVVFADTTVLDHYDVTDDLQLEWAGEVKFFGHRFGLKLHMRPLYFSPDRRLEVEMVDDFGGIGRWRYAIPQGSQEWGIFGFTLNNPFAVEVFPQIEARANFEFQVVTYHDEP